MPANPAVVHANVSLRCFPPSSATAMFHGAGQFHWLSSPPALITRRASSNFTAVMGSPFVCSAATPELCGSTLSPSHPHLLRFPAFPRPLASIKFRDFLSGERALERGLDGTVIDVALICRPLRPSEAPEEQRDRCWQSRTKMAWSFHAAGGDCGPENRSCGGDPVSPSTQLASRCLADPGPKSSAISLRGHRQKYPSASALTFAALAELGGNGLVIEATDSPSDGTSRRPT